LVLGVGGMGWGGWVWVGLALAVLTVAALLVAAVVGVLLVTHLDYNYIMRLGLYYVGVGYLNVFPDVPRHNTFIASYVYVFIACCVSECPPHSFETL